MNGRKLRIGLNGFGRIGRAIARINAERTAFDLVALNDINPDIRNLAYLLQYDSTYGRFRGRVSAEDSFLHMGEADPIRVFRERNIADVPWSDLAADVVIDASGMKMDSGALQAVRSQGVRHCIVTNETAPDLPIKPVIVGVNHETVTAADFGISTCTCDANALVPILHLLESQFGIEYGALTTLHPWLSYQKLLDGAALPDSNPAHIQSTYVLGRNSTQSLIPKTTSCLRVAARVLPWVEDKFISMSYRVPTMIVSSADLVIRLSQKADTAAIIQAFEAVQRNQHYPVIHNGRESLVSIDYTGSEYSAVIDHRWTGIHETGQLKLVLWYDNEWGYASRVVDTIDHLAAIG